MTASKPSLSGSRLTAGTFEGTTDTFLKPRRYRTTMTLLLALVLAYAGTFGMVRGAEDPSPMLISAEITVESQAVVTVVGEGFTPDGMVYIVIYDQWGTALFETRWVTASKTVYGLYGSRSAKDGYVLGGAISEEFAQQCGTTTMVRAYDHQTATWSNWIDVDVTTAAISNHCRASVDLDPIFGFTP